MSDDIHRIKAEASKADVVYILSGMWKTPAERCFLWLGGFHSSELHRGVSELNANRTNLIKESIRMGYNDFGDFYYAHGALGDAFKNYVRTRDYCTTAKHIIHMCLNAILVSIEIGQFTHVTSYVSKAEQSPEAVEPIVAAKLRCAAGLAHLEAKKYKLAARMLLMSKLEPSTEQQMLGNVASYMGQMAIAMGMLGTLDNFICQADNVRQTVASYTNNSSVCSCCHCNQ
ncbi:hypothetical protein POM88_030118 [Heracleum sosnowskyi]|uniref:DOG1 domain-containing protein n=1 Tax=Heracleum sosnowskyi TaxID=360622 RepID=A0AAD8HVD8_9APIA|nr:hypothetical protein POM88_030118 [Heracleum sosnowskyi]